MVTFQFRSHSCSKFLQGILRNHIHFIKAPPPIFDTLHEIILQASLLHIILHHHYYNVKNYTPKFTTLLLSSQMVATF